MDKYRELINRAAAEYARASEGYRTVATEARGAQAELDSLNAEAAAIQARIADFEAGRVVLEAEEYIRIEDRRRWLSIRIKQQAAIVRTAAGKTELEASKPRSVASTFRGQLDKMLEEDARSAAAARRAELDAVLRG